MVAEVTFAQSPSTRRHGFYNRLSQRLEEKQFLCLNEVNHIVHEMVFKKKSIKIAVDHIVYEMIFLIY